MRAWWRRRTLRFRLALWYALGGSVLLSGFSAGLYLYVAHEIARPLDYELRNDIIAVQRRLTVDAAGGLWWDRKPLPPRTAWRAKDPWFEIWKADRTLLCRCWPLDDVTLDRLPSSPTPERETFAMYSVDEEIRLRLLSMPFGPGGRGWMIRVMRIHEPATDALGALRWIMIIMLPTVVALLVTGGWAVTRHWLRPLDAMVAEADRITAQDLGQRLPVGNPHDELGRLAGVFNHTLGRLEDSFRALDRFVADAAHELRTPLTTLRSVGEVGLHRGRTVDEYREIIGSMLEEAQRLQRLVERLLELAHVEGGASTPHTEALRLDQLAAVCAGELGVLAEHKNQRIVIEGGACTVSSDPVLLRQALQNLLDNAIKYSPEGSIIRIEVTCRPDAGVVAVIDEGPGIAPEHQAKVADRFFRLDQSRVHDRGGFGLGLAITKAYLHVLGGSLDYERMQPRGSRFSLVLPRRDEAAG